MSAYPTLSWHSTVGLANVYNFDENIISQGIWSYDEQDLRSVHVPSAGGEDAAPV